MDNSTGTAHAKQYVFVDEYNRHKRLKVMRACDGCRRRKIRCDGALQNGPWPCGACLRLKLKCIPPTLDAEDDASPGDVFQQTPPLQRLASDASSTSSHVVYDWSVSTGPSPSESFSSAAIQTPPRNAMRVSDQRPHPANPSLPNLYTAYEDYIGVRDPTSMADYQPGLPTLNRELSRTSSSPADDANDIDTTVSTLSEAIGELKIDHTGVAPYITSHQRSLAEAPAVEEFEIQLPDSVSTDSTVKIPAEMMPSDERVADYFGYFFDHVHPYIPVLSRAGLYHQWRTARDSISPLILEAIFACVTRFLGEPHESDRWLALASRHEERFKDTPRLSTIQAMILLLKAREAQPKRGYYYRSWMSVKYMTTMATDLRLNEHHDQHQNQYTCKLSELDCAVRTRLWQTLFSIELMVGAAQGRSDFAVELETVDFAIHPPSARLEEFEHYTSRRYTYFAQTIRNIKQTNMLYQSMKRTKPDWALDPKFANHNQDLVDWLEALPHDLQMHYPEDRGSPWLRGDHFVAYMHVYHHLVVVMHHRPQLQALLERRDGSFKFHLDVCTSSASMICRLQEALLRDFGLHGLLFMIRGVNFSIYCVLTCTMLHLAAITSPDPLLNSEARMYFTRHMRILEHCSASAGPDMQIQINALREAFSSDTSKPFELKPTLGLRSPALASQPTPVPVPAQAWSHLQDAASSKTMSPASSYDQSFDNASGASTVPYPTPNSGYDVPLSGVNSASQMSTSNIPYAAEPVPHQRTPEWDPSGIFNSWNTAFGAAGAPPPQPQPQAVSSMVQPTSAPSGLAQHPILPSSQVPSYPTNLLLPNTGTLVSEAAPIVPSVTPIMWQDAFTSAYVSGHGHKRFHEDPAEPGSFDQYSTKRRG